MKKILTILFFWILITPVKSEAQTGNVTQRFWKLYSFFGEARLNGYYRQQDRKGNQINEKQESSLFSAGILMQTKSYIWHPKFIVLDLGGEFTPDKSNEKYLVIPDQAETRDMRKLDARLTLFPQNKFSISSYYNYGRVYNSRENLSSIRSSGNNWGSSLYYHTKKIPFSVSYTNWNQDEAEIQTGRRFLNRQHNLEGRANTSLGTKGKQDLLVSRNEYFRKDYSNSEVFNKINTINYNAFIFFGRGKRNTQNTFLSGMWQKGNEIFSRYQAIESINWELKKHLKLGTNYMFFSDQRSLYSVNQHKIGANLRHQLFESLYSQINYDYSTNKHSLYNDGLHMASLDMTYNKKVLKKHDLNISYRHNLQMQKWNSQDGLIPVLNESVTLKDAQITLLSRPYVTISSIRIKDITGTIIYLPNLDYLVIPQNNFIQLQRIPGGQIPNNSTVYVDYSAVQPGNYEYTASNYLFSAEVSFFNRLFSFYYRKSVQDYNHLKKTDFLTLNYFDEEVLGAKLGYKYISGGVELDNMNSTIIPYKLFRYYINLQGSIKNKMIVSVNGNLYDYKKLNNLTNVRYMDISGSASYHFSPKVSVTTSLFYRQQEGEGVDLNLLNFRTELNASIQKIRFSVFYNYYDRAIANEMIRFNAINVQLSRKF